jgi:hypothetical protein
LLLSEFIEQAKQNAKVLKQNDEKWANNHIT